MPTLKLERVGEGYYLLVAEDPAAMARIVLGTVVAKTAIGPFPGSRVYHYGRTADEVLASSPSSSPDGAAQARLHEILVVAIS
jgi:hypothetical protein